MFVPVVVVVVRGQCVVVFVSIVVNDVIVIIALAVDGFRGASRVRRRATACT